jgi:hypothetical protein
MSMKDLYIKLIKKLIPDYLREDAAISYKEEQIQRNIFNLIIEDEKRAKEKAFKEISSNITSYELNVRDVYCDEVYKFLGKNLGYDGSMSNTLTTVKDVFSKLDEDEFVKVSFGKFYDMQYNTVNQYLNFRLIQLLKDVKDELICFKMETILQRENEVLEKFRKEKEVLHNSINHINPHPTNLLLPKLEINKEGQKVIQQYYLTKL